MSTPPNLLSDIFRIEDLNTRQAVKSVWDALNSARAETARLQQQIAALQAQDAATAAQLASVGVQGLTQVVGTLNQQVGTANDHPYIILQNSTNQTIPDTTLTFLGWDTELLISAGDFHSVSSRNHEVNIGKKPGLWLAVLSIIWASNGVGDRTVSFGDATSALSWSAAGSPNPASPTIQLVAGLLVSRGAEVSSGSVVGTPVVRVTVVQTSGGDLDVDFASVWALYYLSPLAVGQRSF